ncbi:MAG TPA: SDR family oxidoreductase [Candidatus Baltobacteraceae bacterium]|jgi:NAD(P)-dependent dehydrogenase (short-subunit alcohol dehydrogenase family)
MPSEIAGKHALVTGGGRGIGQAIAKALAERGARISIVSRTVHEHAGASADVTNEDQVRRAFEACREKNGPIEILVNNSGIAESAPLMRTGLAMWERIMATNVTGTFLCTREAVEDMLIAKWGRIVNVASVAGLGGAPYVSAYCASKHAVVGFTRSIAAEFEGTGVTANVVCPGYTETDMMRKALENIKKFTGCTAEEARERLASTNPGGRIATVDEVAEATLEFVTGDHNGAAMVVPGNVLV